MGLPLFITPIEPDEAAKTTDKSAARSRSSIRRQRTVRRPTHHLRPEERNDHLRSEGPSPPILRVSDLPPEIPEILSPTEDLEAEREAIRRVRNAVHRRRAEAGRWQPAGALTARSLTPPAPPVVSSYVPPMPPVPESRDFEGNRRPVQYARRGRSDRLWPETPRRFNYDMGPYPAPTRRETSTDLATTTPGTQLPSLTPNFSPARRYALEESVDRSGADRLTNYRNYPYNSEDIEQASSLRGARPPNRDPQAFRDLPPLRRMGRRTIAAFEAGQRRIRAAHLDGLGDRDRSLSPEGDGAWETMLTTLTPDPQLPSAGSSFASTSAAASTSSNAGSSGTSLTTMSSTPNPTDLMNAAVENACDLIEDAQDFSDMSDTEAEDEDDLYELQIDHEARDIFWRSYADVVAARDDRVARHSGVADSDTLGGMQRIVRRLARREDIPDEWWAEAGLSRNFPRETIGLRS